MIPIPPIPTKLLIAVSIAGLIFALCFVSYKYGHTKAEAEYTKNVAVIIEKARKDQEDLNTKLNEISHENTTSISNERRRIEALQKQLRGKQDAVQCVKDSGGGDIAIIPDSSVRLLIESTNYKALPKATDKPCLISETNTITASDLTDYTICIIGEYNATAWRYTGLIDSVNAFKQAAE